MYKAALKPHYQAEGGRGGYRGSSKPSRKPDGDSTDIPDNGVLRGMVVYSSKGVIRKQQLPCKGPTSGWAFV